MDEEIRQLLDMMAVEAPAPLGVPRGFNRRARYRRARSLLATALCLGLLVTGVSFGARVAFRKQELATKPPSPEQTCPSHGWKLQSTNINGDVQSVSASSRNDIWAVGSVPILDHKFPGYEDRRLHSLVIHWNGVRWQEVPTPTQGVLGDALTQVVALSPTDVWVGGRKMNFAADNAHSTNEALLMHWNGVRWNVVPTPVENRAYFISALAVSGMDVWIQGSEKNQAAAFRWDGRVWASFLIPKDLVGSFFASRISVESPTSVYLIQSAPGSVLLHWDGSSFSAVLSDWEGSEPHDVLSGLAAISQNDLWISGDHTAREVNSAPLRSGPLLKHWNGHRWKNFSVPSVAPFESIRELSAVSPNNIWGVGEAGASADQSDFTPVLIHWNGKQWQNIPTSASVYHLTTLKDGTVIAMGFGYISALIGC